MKKENTAVEKCIDGLIAQFNKAETPLEKTVIKNNFKQALDLLVPTPSYQRWYKDYFEDMTNTRRVPYKA